VIRLVLGRIVIFGWFIDDIVTFSVSILQTLNPILIASSQCLDYDSAKPRNEKVQHSSAAKRGDLSE
jgi:hypothetical protein